MIRRSAFAAIAMSVASQFAAAPALANEPPGPARQKLVNDHRFQLLKWASNTSGGLAGMSPARWTERADTDPVLKGVLGSPAGKFVGSLDGRSINKVVLRDKAGNLVAANTKVALYNVSHRPVFKTAITGQPWQQDAVRKDVTTQIKSVQIAVPVKDGAGAIGVMHASATAE